MVLRHTVTWGGTYRDIKHGIARGWPLSPLLGAFYLRELDLAIAALPVFYLRHMDDILILASTRWKLRRAVLFVNRIFETLGFLKHPERTFIGRIDRVSIFSATTSVQQD